MSKLTNDILDKISEKNNEYREVLKSLNSKIDEVNTSVVNELVVASNYNLDFSNMVSITKEKLVNAVAKVVESYVIKDLRGVETVNEQFVEKINGKIDSADINNNEDKDAFINSLSTLLNDKYLEIVKIKRIDFFDVNGINENIENTAEEFKQEMLKNNNIDETSLNGVLDNFKKEVYNNIKISLQELNSLYLNNFSSEINNALNNSIDFAKISYDNEEKNEAPYIPEINPVLDDSFNEEAIKEEVPLEPIAVFEPTNESEELETPIINIPIEENVDKISDVEIKPMIDTQDIELKEVEIPSEELNSVSSFDSVEQEPSYDYSYNSEPTIEIETPVVQSQSDIYKEPLKKSIDVEEILKIAKSPIVTLKEEQEAKSSFVSPIITQKEETFVPEFNEKEIVKEMIKRLQERLNEIEEKEKQLEEEEKQLNDDEAFVNDLIESSNNKLKELDEFERSLDEKEQELNNKEQELNRKIESIMPFANAVLKEES